MRSMYITNILVTCMWVKARFYLSFKFNLYGMGGIENVSGVYMLRALGLVGGCCVHNIIIQLCII